MINLLLSDAPVGLTLSAVSESTSQKEHTTLLDADGDHATIDPATNRDPPPTSGEAALSELAEKPCLHPQLLAIEKQSMPSQ
ncbi:hypothetical protein BSLG_002902 [Batrachochytrium salamandrivorans]|nr:hypothetical protein BSLG_002902 [Batrachochytrium salamandrivorans]